MPRIRLAEDTRNDFGCQPACAGCGCLIMIALLVGSIPIAGIVTAMFGGAFEKQLQAPDKIAISDPADIRAEADEPISFTERIRLNRREH